MANSRVRTISYVPRYTQMEAYDLLPREVRDALKIGATEWDTAFILRYWRQRRKHWGSDIGATNDTVRKVFAWHDREIDCEATRAIWSVKRRRPGQRNTDLPMTPHVLAGATMQDDYRRDV